MMDFGDDGAVYAETSFPHNPFASPSRILLVEDDARFAATLRDAVIEVGLEPVLVGAIDDDFVAFTRRCAPAVVVVDLFLPTADALRLGRWIGGLCRGPVIVVVPGSTSPAIPEAATDRLRVLRRPVAPDVLAHTLAQIVRMRRWSVPRGAIGEIGIDPDAKSA
ncbi:MAG: hypothetical protein QM753_01570 [Thermomicrobiales bacterium]